MEQEKFEIFALVELMGRNRLAGKVSERVIAGQGFLHVQVPETKNLPAFSRFISPSAVYAINPITKDVMEQFAESIKESPIEAWDIHKFVEKANLKFLASDTKEMFETE